MAQFVILERGDGQLIFRFKANNGESLLSSEGFSSKAGVESGISIVKKNAKFDSSYVRADGASGYSFRIKASNGQIIGFSEQYILREARERAIEELKRTVEAAMIEKPTSRLNQ